VARGGDDASKNFPRSEDSEATRRGDGNTIKW